MSITKRIIPCLDIDNGRVVKGVKFKDILSKKFPYKEKLNTMISTNSDEIKLK